MGHKVHPTGFRLGVIRDWQSKWYADRHYAEFLQEDVKLREAIRTKYPEAAISLIEIDRQAKDVTLTLYTARPGIVIGRGGQRVDEIRLYLENLIGKKARLNIQEIRQPELDAYLVARSIAEQIERRVAYRRAMRQAIFRTMQAGAKGIKVGLGGRLGNAEIARRQTLHQGQLPLHTLRADIDYGFTEAHTTLGRIGIKVWIYKGEILPEPKLMEIAEMVEMPKVAPLQEAELTTAAEPVAEATTEAATEKPEKRTTRTPARRRTKTATETPEEKPAEPVAEATTEAATEKPEKRTTRTPARRRTKTATAETEPKITEPAADKTAETEASDLKEEEEKDDTT